MLGTLATAAWLAQNWGWIVSGMIVVCGILIAGASDGHRFSFTRVWAISGVCFDESIRKRVLWIAPLAIFGVIGITQFQRALDEQDALRQSVKICLFATGLVVMLSSIILACTNLPKEIESRVIYTIVTKPITRLELVLGKVIGFARVSLALIGIMGIFTWVYMRIGAEQKSQQITYRLNEGDVGDSERARLSEYKQTGLLTRMVRYANSTVGRVPTQIDFADYRPVAGVMMPFKRIFGWVSGREEYTLTEIKPDVPVEDAKFAKPPAPPVPPK